MECHGINRGLTSSSLAFFLADEFKDGGLDGVEVEVLDEAGGNIWD